jgi:type IV pilus assembly protein PilA
MLARIHKSQKDKDQGFTLIELLVVMIIIGILAAIAIPVFLNQRQKAVDSGIKSDLKTAADFEETWLVDHASAGYTSTATDFSGANVKFSSGDKIEVAVDSAGTSYCVRGSNANGSGGTTKFFWYDSAGGGLQSGAPNSTYNANACAGTFTQVS